MVDDLQHSIGEDDPEEDLGKTIDTEDIALLAVETAEIADGAVTTPKLAGGAVTSAKQSPGAASGSGVDETLPEATTKTVAATNVTVPAGGSNRILLTPTGSG